MVNACGVVLTNAMEPRAAEMSPAAAAAPSEIPTDRDEEGGLEFSHATDTGRPGPPSPQTSLGLVHLRTPLANLTASDLGVIQL